MSGGNGWPRRNTGKHTGAEAVASSPTDVVSGWSAECSEVNLDGTVRGAWNISAEDDNMWLRPPALPQEAGAFAGDKDWSSFAQRHYARRQGPTSSLCDSQPPPPPAHVSALLKLRCEASGSSFAIFWGEHQGGLVVVADYLAPDRRAVLMAQGHVRSYAEASRDWILDAEGHNPVAKALKSNWQWRLAGMRKITDDIRQSEARAALARDEARLANLRSGGGKEPVNDGAGIAGVQGGDDVSLSGDVSPPRRHAGARSGRSLGQMYTTMAPARSHGGGELGGWEDPSKVGSCGGSRASSSGGVSPLEGTGRGVERKGFFRGKLPSKDFLKRVMPKLL